MRMDKRNLENWLKETCCKYNYNTTFEELTAISIFYLCYEIKNNFGIQFTSQVIEEGIFLSSKKVIDYLYECIQ